MRGRSSVLAIAVAAWFAVLAEPSAATAADEQFFASIYLGGDKIGQVHVRQRRGEAGDIEELRARASVSFLGARLHDFTHDASEVWSAGALQSLSGRADENGEIDVVSIRREPGGYVGTRNGAPVTVPLDAFPNSLWHYEIGNQTLLFNIINLRLMQVTVSKQDDVVSMGGKSVAAERFTFAGDYRATVWFGKDHRFLKARYKIRDREIEIRLDP